MLFIFLQTVIEFIRFYPKSWLCPSDLHEKVLHLLPPLLSAYSIEAFGLNSSRSDSDSESLEIEEKQFNACVKTPLTVHREEGTALLCWVLKLTLNEMRHIPGDYS